MALKPEEISELISLPADIDSLDQAKEYFGKTFVSRKLATEDDDIRTGVMHDIFGRLNTKAAQIFGMKKSEYEGKKLEEILELGHGKLSGKIKELEENSKNTVDETVKKLTADTEKYKSDAAQYKEMAEANAKALEETKANSANELKKEKLNYRITDAKMKVPLIELSKAQKIAFDATVSASGYDFEGDDIVVLDEKGNKIKDSKNIGFKKLGEHLEEIANDLGILKKNNASGSGTKIHTPVFTGNNQNNNNSSQNGSPARKVATKVYNTGTVTKD